MFCGGGWALVGAPAGAGAGGIASFSAITKQQACIECAASTRCEHAAGQGWVQIRAMPVGGRAAEWRQSRKCREMPGVAAEGNPLARTLRAQLPLNGAPWCWAGPGGVARPAGDAAAHSSRTGGLLRPQLQYLSIEHNVAK